jgi:MinD superfamily P-loop ATPase
MERIVLVAQHFNVPTKVVINKYDINFQNTDDIKRICAVKDIEVLAQLPFSQKVIQSMVEGMPVVKYCDDQITEDSALLRERIR